MRLLKFIVMTVSLFAFLSVAEADDKTRRQALKAFAKKEFSVSKNHCKSFAKVAEHATTLTSKTGEWLEDMALVIIGEDIISRKDRGKFYHGIKTSDSGFKPELRDGSSQVEHAMAGIYLAKLLPGISAYGGTLKEGYDALKRQQALSTQDVLLFTIGGDIGERLHDRELHRVGFPIRKTMCE